MKLASSTKAPVINRTVLMSGADYFDVVALNPYSFYTTPVDRSQAKRDFATIQKALRKAGITIESVPAPKGCQDGIFTANWGITRGDVAVLSSLPAQRAAEEAFAKAALEQRGFRVLKPPYRFSGQGDALPCGDFLFAGSGYRTDPRVHDFLAAELGYQVISVNAVPQLNEQGQPVINELSGWPDSFFYDIDLAISILSPELIAWFPGAFTPESQAAIRATPMRKIEVSEQDAMNFACNLVSTGSHVVMGNRAPDLQKAIEAEGLQVTTVDVRELLKGGGFIRCTTLTLDNQ